MTVTCCISPETLARDLIGQAFPFDTLKMELHKEVSECSSLHAVVNNSSGLEECQMDRS